jgi:hypothetical protein
MRLCDFYKANISPPIKRVTVFATYVDPVDLLSDHDARAGKMPHPQFCVLDGYAERESTTGIILEDM